MDYTIINRSACLSSLSLNILMWCKFLTILSLASCSMCLFPFFSSYPCTDLNPSRLFTKKLDQDNQLKREFPLILWFSFPSLRPHTEYRFEFCIVKLNRDGSQRLCHKCVRLSGLPKKMTGWWQHCSIKYLKEIRILAKSEF